jgi:hypothetical protein
MPTYLIKGDCLLFMNKYSTIENHPELGAIFIPNDVIEGNGFYISYNDYDVSIYGSDTTIIEYL